MTSRVRAALPAAASIGERINGIASVNVDLRCRAESLLVEVAGQAVVRDLVVQLPAESQVGERPVLDASACADSVSAKVLLFPEVRAN